MASKQDITRMRAVQEQLAEVGKAVAKYRPRFQYVAIDARGMDHDPKHLRIVFRQGETSYALRDEDYAFVMGDHFIVRLPDGIKPGEVTVTLQNIGIGQVSVPAIAIFEVTQAGRQ